MTKRLEDLSDDELRALTDDLSDRIDVLDNDGAGAPEDMVEQWEQASREQSRRDALAARKAGRYSVTLDVDGVEEEYELKATTQDDAEAEAKDGVAAMARMSGQAVTIKHFNEPLPPG